MDILDFEESVNHFSIQLSFTAKTTAVCCHCISIFFLSLFNFYSDLSEQKVDNFTRSMRSFEESVHFMYNRVSETHKRLAGRKFRIIVFSKYEIC